MAQGHLQAQPCEIDTMQALAVRKRVKNLVLLGWGFLAPVVWGFSARWLPAFLGIAKPRGRLFGAALILDAAGVLSGVAGFTRIATPFLAAGAVLCGISLRLVEHPRRCALRSRSRASRLVRAWLADGLLLSEPGRHRRSHTAPAQRRT